MPETAETPAEIKARIKAIMSLSEASGHRALAQHLAFNAETTIDVAREILAVAAEETSTDANTPQSYYARRAAGGTMGDEATEGDGAAAVVLH